MGELRARPRRRVLRFACGATAFAILLAACGSNDDDTAAGDTAPSTAAVETEGTIPGSTTITTAPPDDGPLPPVQTLQADPDDTMNDDPIPAGAERLRFAYGPVRVAPGQNNIAFSDMAVPKPDEAGFIVRIAPNIMRADGTVPPVDVIHLHHGVWLNQSRQDATVPLLPERVFAAGEEKSIMLLPEGFGYPYDPGDEWIINYMIHNLFPEPEDVWITYDIDFIPATAPEAADIVPTRPLWMDIDNGSVYPIFDAIKGDGGEDGQYTYPVEAPADDDGRFQSEWVADRDMVLVQTAGHLHPGGLNTKLFVRRGTDERLLFTSEAQYYEPAGAVSWDVSMTRTDIDWRVAIRAGDVLRIETTYDTARASWYESMGIMVVAAADASASPEPGVDPFTGEIDTEGEVSHDELPENDNHGGEESDLIDPTELPDGPVTDRVDIADFVYSLGDFSDPATPTVMPVVQAGQSITFDNTFDNPIENGIWHTITSCAAPCNRTTGVAYPLADADIQFDSGQLGTYGPPTAGTVTWQTPATLPPGTYTYFCRVHPFMRGAFRVL